eukprot:8401226-Prorocentrum_lima.AAC.1
MLTVLAKKTEESMSPDTSADLQVIVDWYAKRFLPTKQWLRGQARHLAKEYGLSPRVSLRKLNLSEKPAVGGDA